MALKQVKSKIIATKKTGQVTKAMEAVSAVKMRKSQERALQSRPYVRSALRILSRLANSRDGLNHPFVSPRTSGKKLLIIVTSDKGLAGSVNSAVLKLADQLIGKQPTDVIAVGRKAAEYSSRNGLETLGSFVNVSDDVRITDVAKMSTLAFERFYNSKYSSVEIVYQNFLSTFEQLPTHRRILPLDPGEIQFILESIRPRKGKYSELEDQNSKVIDYVVEPDSEAVLKTLLPQLCEIMIYHALLESKACEHSARMVAMKNATDKAKEMVKSLTIIYNKARQTAITSEVSEITAGAEAMKV